MFKERQSSSQTTSPSSKTRLCYSKEKMLTIRESTPARTRPAMLSSEFDNDDGLFSPDKWIQHFWQCEGIGNRVITKKRADTKTGKSESSCGIYDMDIVQAVLSPQRKAFLSGCKAASPKPVLEEERPGSKGRWRHGHLTSNGGVDFKPAFQKNALDSRSRAAASTNGPGMTTWRSSNNDTHETHGRHYGDRSEKMPEWLDEGPSSMTDVIELKGFEDDEPRDRRKVSETIEEKRPESKPETSAHVFPSTDEEFAAIIGLLDVSDTSSANRSVTRQDSMNPPSSSRLTRFFSKNQNVAEENTDDKPFDFQRPPQLSPLQQILKPAVPRPIIGHPRQSPETAAAGPQQNLPPALQQLFASVPQKIIEPSRAMTVEELERATLGSLSHQVQNGASSSGHAAPRRDQNRVMTVEELERNTLRTLPHQPQGGHNGPNPYLQAQLFQAQMQQSQMQQSQMQQSQMHQSHMQPNLYQHVPIPREHNRVMTVEELERNTFRTLPHQPQGGHNGQNPYLQAQLFQAQMQQSHMHQQQMPPNLLQHVPIYSIPQIFQSGMNAPNPYMQAQIFQAQMQQSQMHQSQMQQNLLQQVPIPVLQKVFAANSPTNPSSPPAAKFKSP
ncbi:nucleocytoplasmic shuttling protein for mRNA cap-binding EIF4E domain-containing protein [Ditylenchus destructor]|nr:nucleocytoplasmic shuttling protein for mRNA cap-binding EIF4E domain-containing protein [Ditylenchus destructor]